MVTFQQITQAVGRKQPMAVLQNGQIVPAHLVSEVRPGSAPVAIPSVKRHVFEGDDVNDAAPEMPNDVPTGDATWWERAPEVLAREKAAIVAAFPQFQLSEDDGRLRWMGTFRNSMGRDHLVEVVYPANYDVSHRQPSVYVLSGPIGRRKHTYLSGALCLDSKENPSWDESDTAVTALGWTAEWIVAQHYYEVYNKWLFPSVEHHRR